MHTRRLIGLMVMAVLLCVFIPGQTMAWEVGVARATRKILPASPIPEMKAVTLKAARNEWEAFQIVIRDSQGVSGVEVVLSDLCNPQQSCVAASRARLYREHFVKVTTPSSMGATHHERLPGRYPDPLIPFKDPHAAGDVALGAPFDLSADEVGVVFVDWYVPENTPPGAFSGTATVTAGGGKSVKLPITLIVWEFEIPKERSIGTAFGFGANQVRYHHGGPGTQPAGDYQAIVDRYYLALHEHRIDPTTVNGPVEFTFDAQGKLNPVDWSAYDAVVGPWVEGSRFPDGVGVARFNVSRFRPGSGLGNLTEDQYKQAAAAFAQHLKDKGWWEKAYIYAIDEPWLHDPDGAYARINRDADILFQASDLWRGKVLVTGPLEERIKGKVGIWCPVTPMYEDWFYHWEPMAGWDKYTERMALGEELWFYVCNANTPPYAGYDIDSAIGYEPRIVKWGSWYERASGFLYWRVSYWVENDPWNVLSNIPQFGVYAARNGDGMLLYPGDHDGTAGGKGSPPGIAVDGPIVSYRLKQIRDGLEDWEMFKLASDLGAETFVRQQVQRAYKRFGDFFFPEGCTDDTGYCPDDQPWTLDEEVLHDVREQVALKILHLKFPAKYVDPEARKSGCGGCRSAPAGPGSLLFAFLILIGLYRRIKSAQLR